MNFPNKDMAISTILVVENIERSKKWYLETLGATFFREYDGTTLVVKFIDNWIVLVTKGEPTPDKPDISFVTSQNKNEVSHSFTIRVKNCQESYNILKSRGAEFLTAPYDHGNEIRCFFRDPDGHLFEISQA